MMVASLDANKEAFGIEPIWCAGINGVVKEMGELYVEEVATREATVETGRPAETVEPPDGAEAGGF